MVELESQLDAFDADARREALGSLAAKFEEELPVDEENVNMHFHSFFSFNAEGWSPSRIAWEARKGGLYAAALCDFDVLDGLEEFLKAGLRLGLRSAVHLETRAYVRDFASVDINSPGEPGVSYIMGAGFVRVPEGDTPQAAGLAGYRDRARQRNESLIDRVNAAAPTIAVDYDRDVLPLTPGGCATERHIVRAYRLKAVQAYEERAALVDFWAALLKRDSAAIAEMIDNVPAMEDVVRSGVAKQGGIGYEQPSETTFPPVDEFIGWVRSCAAVPMITWLDGTSGGESDAGAYLDCLVAKGCAALNIIPDRNWNYKDPEQKALKVAKLNEMVAAADARQLPINIGTEMNKLGLPFVDSLESEALAPHKERFLRGARIMVGHSLLSRYADFSYLGAPAEAEFGSVEARNDFFERVGKGLPLTERQANELEDMGPAKALAWFHER